MHQAQTGGFEAATIGIDLDDVVGMKTKTRHLLKQHTRDMIRWQLRMRDRFLTCGVTKSEAEGFSVVTVSHRDVRNGTVEIFRDLASALQRHAAIVNELRSTGWSIASYTQ